MTTAIVLKSDWDRHIENIVDIPRQSVWIDYVSWRQYQKWQEKLTYEVLGNMSWGIDPYEEE